MVHICNADIPLIFGKHIQRKILWSGVNIERCKLKSVAKEEGIEMKEMNLYI